jgi:pyruvate formate lyase activating enzyme
MKIGGLQKTTLIDYPGKIGAIVFTMGCNFRCPYCHNPELVDETAGRIEEDVVLAFLEKRKGLLEAVTVTGGEPTVHDDLIPFMQKLKAVGYLVKLDSNGTHPDVLRTAIREKCVDYIAMDMKSPLQTYGGTVARPVDIEKIRESITLLIEDTVDYEFRTTVVKSLLSPEDIRSIGEDIRGAKRYFLQKFVPTKTLNPAFLRKTTYTDAEFEEMRTMMSEYVKTCDIR